MLDRSIAAAALVLFILGGLTAGTAQEAEPADARRIRLRIQALQREAERLAGESRTLLGDLRRREVDRDLKMQQLKQAELVRIEAERQLQETTDRLSELELQRISQLPDIKAQLVDMYKRGRAAGYARLIFGARDVQEFARATRAVAALATLSEQRINEHRRTVEAVREERAAFERTARELQTREAEARRAKATADRAVASAAELIREIDSRRDLTARYLGELQEAYSRLQNQIVELAPATSVVAVPLPPFRGALDWPVEGQVISAFGQPSSRLGGDVARNGIEIAAAEDAPVRAIHGGTVGYSGPFTGFGRLVILDHGGNNYSLYAYLASTELQEGNAVETGSEVGRVGAAPAGPPALYFEIRIDGRSVNPVQWLKPR